MRLLSYLGTRIAIALAMVAYFDPTSLPAMLVSPYFILDVLVRTMILGCLLDPGVEARLWRRIKRVTADLEITTRSRPSSILERSSPESDNFPRLFSRQTHISHSLRLRRIGPKLASADEGD